MGVKERESNFELLRILAMLLIIAYHLVAHCMLDKLDVSVYCTPTFYGRLFFFQVIMSFGSIANACFILISGYFMAGREGKSVNLVRIGKKLMTQIVFGAVVLMFGTLIFYKLKGEAYPTPFTLIDIRYANTWVWFIGYYFLLMVIGAFFLNDFLAKLEKSEYKRFLVVLLLLISLQFTSGLIENFINSLSAVAGGIFFYTLGGYIRKYDPFGKVRTWVLLMIPVLVYGILFVSYYNNTVSSIGHYLEDVGLRRIAGSGIDSFKQPVFGVTDTGIIAVVMAVTIFELTRRIKIGCIKPVNALASSTLMIYIIHDNEFFYDLWGLTDWIEMFRYTPRIFAVNYIKWIFLMFAIGAATYLLYFLTCKACDKLRWIVVRR